MKKQWKNARGITLVSLVITILVLVILVGLSVSTVLNSGLISNTKDAVARYQESQENELKYIDKIEMAITGNKLPSIYQEVEYIESTGTQYIDTDYIFPDCNIKIETQLSIGTSTNKGSIGGSVGVGTINRDLILNLVNNKYALTIGGNVLDTTLSPTNTFQTIIGTRTANSLTISIDGVTFNKSSNSIAISNEYHTIFSTKQGEKIWDYIRAKIRNYKMYSNNVLVRDMVACYRKSDNVIGMYDLVNNVFYTNAGTGTFEKGNDI